MFCNAVQAAQKPLAGPVQDLRVNIEFERQGWYSLGPIGAKGWMHVDRNSMTGEARQILNTEVEPGGAANGVLLANPHFPVLRSGPTAGSEASAKTEILAAERGWETRSPQRGSGSACDPVERETRFTAS